VPNEQAPPLGSWTEQWERVQLGLGRVEAIYRGRPETEGTEGARYDLFAFFVTCFHLCDWIENDPDLAEEVGNGVGEHLSGSEDLKVCADLANRTKHSALTRATRTGDPSTGPSGNDVTITPGTSVSHAFWVTSGGAERDALGLARGCIASWREFLVRHDLDTESGGALGDRRGVAPAPLGPSVRVWPPPSAE
jgi:hypothetical protein